MADVLLRAAGLRKAYGRTEALRGVDLEIGEREVVAITGPSGSGKSTLLMTLAGIVRPDAGQVWYGGARLDDRSEGARTRLRRQELGVVLQFGQLVPELTARQNVALPLLLAKGSRGDSDRTALSWLERLDAAGLADSLPGELSGGEAQRVAVARALVSGPRVVFADEPTGAMDTVSGERLLEEMLRAASETGATVVLVTHENRVAARADRELRLRDGVLA